MELREIFGARLKNARIINGMSMDDIWTMEGFREDPKERKEKIH